MEQLCLLCLRVVASSAFRAAWLLCIDATHIAARANNQQPWFPAQECARAHLMHFSVAASKVRSAASLLDAITRVPPLPSRNTSMPFVMPLSLEVTRALRGGRKSRVVDPESLSHVRAPPLGLDNIDGIQAGVARGDARAAG